MEDLQYKMKKYSYKLKHAKNSNEAEIYKNKLRFYKSFQSGGADEAEVPEAPAVPTSVVPPAPVAPEVPAEAAVEEAPVAAAVEEAPVASVETDVDVQVASIVAELSQLKDLAEKIRQSIAALPKSQTEKIDIRVNEAAKAVSDAIGAKVAELRGLIAQKKAEAKDRTFPNLDSALQAASQSVKNIGESVTIKLDVQTPEEVERFLTDSETFKNNLDTTFGLSEASQAGGRRHRSRRH